MNDLSLMQRCLDLARKGEGDVSPNPMVGCVIARKGKIISEGFHRKFGGPHAEIMALITAGRKARNSTLYVNLEPCAHFGKTPPCADAIVQSGISRAVIAMRDPNPLVYGNGIKRLRQAGIDVRLGVLEKEARILNERFVKYMETGMPFTALKLAQTIDGRIADRNGDSKWITSLESRKKVHLLRSGYDAILVGAGAVIKDDPELTVRHTKGRNPLRVVLDGKLSLPVSRKIFNVNDAPTWLFTSLSAIESKKEKVRALVSKGVRVISVSRGIISEPKSVLSALSKEGVTSVLIEGGSKTAAYFIEKESIDRVYLFISSKIVGGGLNSFQFQHPKSIMNPLRMQIMTIAQNAEDIMVEAKIEYKRR